jgi:hemerythrin
VARPESSKGVARYGLDGFHFDKEKRNLYLFQFKYSESHQQFKDSFKRLIDAGMQYIFDADRQDQHQNQLIQQIKSSITDNTAIIDRVMIHFVFLGDPKTAEDSPV